jgi:hypothetical protein
MKFLNFYDDNNIHVDWLAVAHPKTNGQVERANDMILQGLKPGIFKRLIVRRYQERIVCPHEFHVGDLVLRRDQGSQDRHKLLPPWQGPFIIHEVLR